MIPERGFARIPGKGNNSRKQRGPSDEIKIPAFCTDASLFTASNA